MAGVLTSLCYRETVHSFETEAVACMMGLLGGRELEHGLHPRLIAALCETGVELEADGTLDTVGVEGVGLLHLHYLARPAGKPLDKMITHEIEPLRSPRRNMELGIDVFFRQLLHVDAHRVEALSAPSYTFRGCHCCTALCV